MENQKLFNIIDLTGNIFIIMAIIYGAIYSVKIMIEMKEQNQLLRQEVKHLRTYYLIENTKGN